MLSDGKIGVIKSRTDDYIAAKIAEACDRGKYRRIEPTIHTADDIYRTSYIGPKRAGHTVECAIAGHDVDRAPALRLDDHGDLTSVKKPIAAKWQFVNRADNEAVASVKI